MVVAPIFVRVSVIVTVAPAAAAPFESVIVPSNEPLTACPTPTVMTLAQINASNKSLFDMHITVSWLKVASSRLAVESHRMSLRRRYYRKSETNKNRETGKREFPFRVFPRFCLFRPHSFHL